MFTDPQALAVLTAAAAVSGAMTWIVALLLVKFRPRHRLSSYAVAMFAVPAATITVGVIMFNIDTARHPTADLPAIALAGYIGMAGFMLLVTAPVALLTLRRSRPRQRRGSS